MTLLILAVILCLTGCGAAGASQAVDDLNKEEMAVLCYYREPEKDEAWDSDMEIVKGRIDALTDGKYIMEETILETAEGPYPAMEFYVPKETYGDFSLRDLSRIMISRPMNLWMSECTSTGSSKYFGEKIELPREAIESVESFYGCPESVNPLDYGWEQKEFNYLKVTLSEEYSEQNPQIWEWKQPNILQDIVGFEGYGSYLVCTDEGNRCFYWIEGEGEKNYCKSISYSYTHEPLSAGFYLLAFPVVEWESGEEIKGTGQIEAGEFKTVTAIYSYVPEEAFVSDANWEQTLQAVRERMDASGVPYALGHLPDNDRSVVIRLEDGIFSGEFMDYVVSNTDVKLSAHGMKYDEDLSAMKVSASTKDGKKALKLDMSEIKKYTLNKISLLCSKAGGSRIVLEVNDQPMAYGECDSVITDGIFVMDTNALTSEDGFKNELEWLPEFLGTLISGTPFPMITDYSSAVTFKNTEAAYLSEEGKLCIPEAIGYSRQGFYDGIKSRLGDQKYENIGFLTSGTPCVQFALPEGETRNAQIAAIMSRVFKSLSEDIFTYGFRFDFLDESGVPVLKFTTVGTSVKDESKFSYLLFYENMFTEEDEKEIQEALSEDESLADLLVFE